MKKNKKFMKETPVIETKEFSIAPTSGSVDEFIEILKQFPGDAKFNLNGIASVDGYIGDDHVEARIFNPSTLNQSEDEPFFNYPEDGCIADECECNIDHEEQNPVMNGHLFGIADTDATFLKEVRHISADKLTELPVVMPNKNELVFEGELLELPQLMCIDEIRQHNMYIAECMAEIHRREIAALLEYNTQCLAHFGIVTNKCMCTIVDKTKDNDLF